jgi:hypothetical protein
LRYYIIHTIFSQDLEKVSQNRGRWKDEKGGKEAKNRKEDEGAIVNC